MYTIANHGSVCSTCSANKEASFYTEFCLSIFEDAPLVVFIYEEYILVHNVSLNLST